MSLSTERIEEITEMAIISLTYPERLSKWENDFLFDMVDKAMRYDTETRLSERQDEILQRIEKKIYSTG